MQLTADPTGVMTDIDSNSAASSDDEMSQHNLSDQENEDGNRRGLLHDNEGYLEDEELGDDEVDSDDDVGEVEAGPSERVQEEQFDDDHDVPPTISVDVDLTAVKFHPANDLVATGTIDGELAVWRYSLEKNEEVRRSKTHPKACRGLEFTQDGKTLFSISKDKSWKMIDVETMRIVVDMQKAHKSALFAMALIDEWLCATGEEDGAVCVWDHRTPKQQAVQTYKQCEDYIADLLIEPQHKKVLLAASAEGTLTALDVRRKKMIMQSEVFEEEFLSLALIKGKKVVCGGSEGSFEIFNWDEFGYIVNAMKSVSKASVDCMKALNESIVIYGCGDGNVRAASFFPNKPLGILGKHCDFPIVSLDLDRERKIAASVSVDQKVRFWSTEGIESKLDLKKGRWQDMKMVMNTKKNNFFSGLVNNGDDNKE